MTNFRTLGLVVSEQKIFKDFPLYFFIKYATPQVGPIVTPGIVLTNLVEVH